MTQTSSPYDERITESIERLNLTDSVKSTAQSLFKQVYENDLYHGRTTENITAGTVYIASRIEGEACNPTSFSSVLGVSREEVLSTSRHLMKRIDGIALQPIEPEPFVKEYAKELDLNEETEETALEIINVCKDEGLLHSGKSPTGFAAGAIYAASKLTDETITQKQVSDVADVSTVTIRNRYSNQLDCFNKSEEK